MKFKYVCLDCGSEFVSDEIMYLCPNCGGSEKEGEFRKGVLSVIYDEEELKRLKEKDHVTMFGYEMSRHSEIGHSDRFLV